MAVRSTKRIEKVWVVTWPKGTTEEYKHESAPRPHDYESIGAEVEAKFTYLLREGKKKRRVYGDVQAVFGNKKEGEAWIEATGNNKCFVLRPAHLSIF